MLISMDALFTIIKKGIWIMFLALVIVRTSSASPTHFSIRGTLRRQSRHYVEPYWLSPCGDVMASLSVKTKYEPLSTKAMKHHYLAIRNYAETLDRLVNSLQTKKEGGDPYLHSQIKQFALAKFPRPPTTMLKQLLDGAPGSLLKESYGMLQFAAVHLSSTERDEVDYEGQYPQELDDLQEGSNGLRALMCSVRMAMRDAGVEPDKDVEKSLKTIDLSPIRDASQRNLRDILRLDGASAILNYIYRVFSALYDRSDS